MELFSHVAFAAAALSAFSNASTSVNSRTRLRPIYYANNQHGYDYLDDDSFGNLSRRKGYGRREKEAEELADYMVNFLEHEGFDFGNVKDVMNLVSFIQNAHGIESRTNENFSDFMNMVKSKGKKVFEATKKFAKKHAKGAVGEAVKMAVLAILKKGLPIFEKTYENAMQRIPLQLRMEYAPMAYSLWSELFRKFKIELPEELTVERFICKGMSKEQCDDVIQKAVGPSKANPELEGEEAKENGDDSDDDDGAGASSDVEGL